MISLKRRRQILQEYRDFVIRYRCALACAKAGYRDAGHFLIRTAKTGSKRTREEDRWFHQYTMKAMLKKLRANHYAEYGGSGKLQRRSHSRA